MSTLAGTVRSGFLRIVAAVESSPILDRAFAALFYRMPWLERLIIGAIQSARGEPPTALVLRDGNAFYLPCDDDDISRWLEKLNGEKASSPGSGGA